MIGAPEVVHGLEKTGFSRQQAEAITEDVEKATLGPSARPATRDDVADVRTETRSLRGFARRPEGRGRGRARRTPQGYRGLAGNAAGLLLAQAAFIIAVLKLLP